MKCFQGMETANPCGSATETEGLGCVTWCNPETEEWKWRSASWDTACGGQVVLRHWWGSISAHIGMRCSRRFIWTKQDLKGFCNGQGIRKPLERKLESWFLQSCKMKVKECDCSWEGNKCKWGLNQSTEQGLFWTVCINQPPSKVCNSMQFAVFLVNFPCGSLPWSHSYGPGLLHTGKLEDAHGKFVLCTLLVVKHKFPHNSKIQHSNMCLLIPSSWLRWSLPETSCIYMCWESNTRKWKGIFHVFTERSVLINILNVALA